MMIDFSDIPFIDHHCHPLDPGMAALTGEELAGVFMHGLGDADTPSLKGKSWGASAELRHHITHLGVVQTMVCQLARLLECPAELEAVASERNRRTAESFAGYAKLLYEDAGIVATVVDAGLPKGDPLLDLFPGRVLRLFQMGPAMNELLEHSTSYGELLLSYQSALERAVKQDGFVGVKAHLAEEVGFGVEPVWEAEAKLAFHAAKKGDAEGYKKLYVAVFTATLLQCQELGVPVHLHSGTTGGLWDGPISDADPFLLVPFIRRPEFRQTRIVLLHAGNPWIMNASAVAHSIPHLWVDIGWVSPWLSLRIVECFRELIAFAPLSKLVIGSGGHQTPEIAWLAALTGKIALKEALGDAVKMGLMTRGQAERTGSMIAHDNAARLYNLES
jgi:predicted TIM-barrel fold metal-dependent hydrolase